MTIFYLREARIEYGPRTGPKGSAILSSACVKDFVQQKLGGSVVERFIVISLSARMRPIAWSLVGIGTEMSCPVGIPSVLRFALMAGGPSFIVAHNHPSGDPSPSGEDDTLTRALADGARAVGLELIDHVIVGEHDTEPYSYKIEGRL